MNKRILPSGEGLRSVVVLAMAAPLVYCVGIVYFFEGRLPWPGPWLVLVALTGAIVGLAATSFLTGGVASRVSSYAELVVRYSLALLLFQFALNKLIPGQFLLYNRDLDLSLRELPARRLAWHFLGYSQLYNASVASVELMAGVLLCSRRTVAGGALLSLSALVNVVVVDTAFDIRGALPIATVMASAAFALVIVHLDVSTLQALVWRRHENVVVSHSMRGRILWAGALTLVFGFPLYMNLAARRGLGGQVSPAGRWEVVECYPTPGLAMCQSQGDKTAPILYIEVGQWGQLVTGSERRNASVSYDQARGSLEVRIAPSNSANEPDLVLTGTVHERDTTVVLHGQAAGVVPFQVRLQRTHWAPWPPVRAF